MPISLSEKLTVSSICLLDWMLNALVSTAVVKCLKAVIEQRERQQADEAQKKIPAMVAELSTNVVRQALESTPVKAVIEWKTKHLGETLQAKRRQAFSACCREQK